MTAVAEPTEAHVEHDHADHDHPTDATYWKVGGVLALLTALEVSTYWWPKEWHKGTAVLLIIMMVIKFATVALYFMHLKFDSKMLRRVFLTGIVLAVGVYIATLSAFTFWHDSGVESFSNPPRSKPAPPPTTEVPALIPTVHHG